MTKLITEELTHNDQTSIVLRPRDRTLILRTVGHHCTKVEAHRCYLSILFPWPFFISSPRTPFGNVQIATSFLIAVVLCHTWRSGLHSCPRMLNLQRRPLSNA